LLVLAGGFYKYAPGPTITGVEHVGANADAPGISLLYPNEYCAGVGTSGLMAGSYCGPGVPFNLFSGGN